MITTVTLNPAIDKVFRARHFTLNKLNRVEKIASDPGGRGINVAHILRALGAEVIAAGFIGGNSGRFLEEELRRAGIYTNFVHIHGETRTDYFILDEERHLQTQINEKGPVVSEDQIRRFKENFARILTQSEMVMIGGSLPQGVDAQVYAELILMAKEKNIPTIFNVREELLSAGLDAQPFLVKPDLRAANELFGMPLNSSRSRIKAARKILEKGVEIVVIRFDTCNQVVVTKDKIWEGSAPDVKLVSRLGAGDAMIGGMTYVLTQGGSLEEAIRLGMAASMAVTLRIGTRVEHREEIEKFVDQIQLKEVEVVETS